MPATQSIPALFLVRNAFRLAWQQRDDGLRLGLIPTLVCFVGLLYAKDTMDTIIASSIGGIVGSDGTIAAGDATQVSADAGFTLLIAAFVVFVALCMASVNWLRFSLIGPMSATGLGLHIGRPHITFIAALLAMAVVAGIFAGVLSIPLALIGGFVGATGWVALLVVALVILARLMPFVVALAISQPISLKDAWSASRGNGIAVAFALFAAELVFLVALILLNQVLVVIGFAQAAPIALLFIAAIADVATTIVVSNVLAAAYRHIIGIKV